MSNPPNQSPPSSSIFTSTIDAFAQQHQELRQQIAIKEEQIKQLEKLAELLSFYSGQMSNATRETQQLLSNNVIQRRLPHHLTPTECQDPIQQLHELLNMEKRVCKGEAIGQLQAKISQLNQEVGKTKSLALEMEEQAKSIDSVILQMENLIKEKEKTLEVAKKVSANADKALKSE